MTAMFLCSAHNRGVDVIRLLLDSGAELNARTAWGDTAVHYAGRFGTADVLEFLLEKGIDVDKPQGKYICLIWISDKIEFNSYIVVRS